MKTEGLRRRRRARFILLNALVLLPCLAGAPAWTLAREPQGKGCQFVPDKWAPSLDQVRSDIEEKANAETNAPQQVLTQTSQNLADLRDAQLFITYVQLMQTLDVTGRAVLFAEQKAWLATRAQAARASVTSKGGTLGALEYSDAFAKITDERRAALQQRLRRHRGPQQVKKEKDKP